MKDEDIEKTVDGARAGSMPPGGNGPLVLVYYGGTLADAANGSQVRTLAQIAFLDQHFDNVALYHYDNPSAPSWTDDQIARFKARFPRVRLVTDRETIGLKILNKFKKLSVLLWPGLSRRIYRLSIPALTPNYARLRDRHPEILSVVNYVDSLAQLNGVEGETTIVETHDLRYFRRAKGTHASLISVRNLLNLRYEISALAVVRAIVAISRNEAYFYRNMLPASDVYYIPDYQPADAVTPSIGGGFDYDLFFPASGNAINVDGFRRLVDREGDRLRGFRIALCGLICERPEIRALAATHPNITLLGFVSAAELQGLYARSKACLSPTDGTGLNIKLVEALRHRKPVFASDASMEALTFGYHECVFPLDPDAMTDMLGDREKLQAASEAAATCYRKFTRHGDLEAFRDALRAMMRSRAVIRA